MQLLELRDFKKLSWVFFYSLSKFQPLPVVNYLWLRAIFKSWVLRFMVDKYTLYLEVSPKYLRRILLFFKQHTLAQMHILSDIACVDFPGSRERFELSYILLSPHYSARIKVVCRTSVLEPVDSIISLFAGANWLEREVWDMFGVFFFNHTDLRRLLTDYGFEGHPLRKDFPLSGFVEVSYSDAQKKLVYEPVSLSQEYRVYEFLNPWSLAQY